MENITSILALVDRNQQGQHALRKALVLARHFGARIELFLCEPSEGASSLEEGQAYLDALRNSVIAEDVTITAGIARGSPVYAGILDKVAASRPDLVVKQIGPGAPARTDSHLISACPVPLLLTRGGAWQPEPRFLALVDAAQEGSLTLQRAVAHAGEYLALTCRAELEILYSDVQSPAENGESIYLPALRQLAGEFRVGRDRTHVLQGPPEAMLVEYLTWHCYDLVLLGATHRPAFTARVGKLTQRLIKTLDCDFVVVK